MTRVALHRWQEFAAVDRVLERCLADLGGMAQFVKPGQTVVIKPNITADAPSSTGGTTHVELVEAIVKQVAACDPGHIVVAEGTGRFGTQLETAFLHGGWREMAARHGVELYNLDGGPHQEIVLDAPRYPHPMVFSKLVLDCDVFITVPCLKTHITADYTVALKNSYALTPQRKRSEIHRQNLLEEALCDLNRIRKPDLSVVDAWDGAEGIAGGTDFERPAGARLMLVGADPVAVDAVSRVIMGVHAPTRYFDWCVEDGVGIGDMEQIDVVGDPLDECIHPFMSAAEEVMLQMPGVTFIDRNACSGCRIAAVSATRRFAFQKLLRPFTVLYGGEGEEPFVEGDVLVVGECARRSAHLGTFVPGDPPGPDAVVDALEAMGCVCLKCRDLVNEVLPEYPESFRANLRVAAAGTQVHVGENVKRGEWHLELLAGECMKRYASVVMERAGQFGMTAGRDVLWLQQCPPTADELRAALDQLAQVTGPADD